MVDRKAIALKLIELRGERTQEFVAEKLNVAPSAVSNWEKGLRIPRDESKVALAELYGVSVNSIFFKQ